MGWFSGTVASVPIMGIGVATVLVVGLGVATAFIAGVGLTAELIVGIGVAAVLVMGVGIVCPYMHRCLTLSRTKTWNTFKTPSSRSMPIQASQGC